MVPSKRARWFASILVTWSTILICSDVWGQTSPALDLSRYPVWFKLTGPAATATTARAAAPATGATNGIMVGPDWQGIDPSLFDPAMVQSRQFKRWWPQFYSRAYPLGYVPDGADATAWAQVQSLDAAQAGAAASISQWVNIGPAPVNNLTPTGPQPNGFGGGTAYSENRKIVTASTAEVTYEMELGMKHLTVARSVSV